MFMTITDCVQYVYDDYCVHVGFHYKRRRRGRPLAAALCVADTIAWPWLPAGCWLGPLLLLDLCLFPRGAAARRLAHKACSSTSKALSHS
jgi:hypothetical protein